jgi:hypothetical protein
MLATACGPYGQGFLVRTPDELARAVKSGLIGQDKGIVTIVNVLMEPGGEKKWVILQTAGRAGGHSADIYVLARRLEFGWLASTKRKGQEKAKL